MDPGPWIQTILANANPSMAGALLIGLLASLGPCPLATNVTALGYITKEIANPRRVVLTGMLYTLGRALSYGLLGIALFALGWQLSRVSNSLQTLAEIALGPLLIVVGLVLLDVLRPTLGGGAWLERASHRVADWNLPGAFLLGALFAIAFCPYSAALYFGVLMPLAFKSPEGLTFPFWFGVGTSIPVVVIGLPLALGAMRVSSGLNLLARTERGVRKFAALTFLGIGIFTLWTWILNAI